MHSDAIFTVFGQGVYLYDVFILIGVIVAMIIADKLAIRSGFSVRLQKLIVICIVSAVILGYLSAVLFQAFYNYMDDPSKGFHIAKDTGATFYGGLIGGAIVFLLVFYLVGRVYCKDKDEPKKRTADLFNMGAVCVPIAHAFGRIGCLFAGCCHGKVTDAWYGITMDYLGEKVVPVQLFESIFLFILGGVLLWLLLKKQTERKLPLFSFYCVFYGLWRFLIEFARGDERGATIVSFLTPSQLIALLLFIGGVIYFCVWLVKEKKKNMKTEI